MCHLWPGSHFVLLQIIAGQLYFLMAYLLGHAPGLGDEFSNAHDVGGHVINRPFLFYHPELVQQFWDQI